MQRLICVLLLLLTFQLKTFAQLDSLSRDTLQDYELRMMGLGESMIKSYDEEQRLTSGLSFLLTMSRAMRVTNSYYYKFDSLKSVSILYSPDEHFRVITWNLVLNNETFHYYGVIQLNPEYMKKIKDTTNLRSFYPLIDRSAQIKKPLDTTVAANFWWGAAYYSIIPVVNKKKTYYTLLGWNGATNMLNKKVADVLYFENNKPFFGAPIFNMNEARFPNPLKRMVFEFSNSASMTLRYQQKKKYLIIENIVPPRQQDYGHPETYLPDGSFEYMILKKGMWEKQKGLLLDFNLE